LGEIRQEMPQDETQRILALIKKEVSESSEEDIIKTLLLTPMIRPLTDIKKMSEESTKDTVLLNMMPKSVLDKFGNRIAQYSTDDKRKEFALLQTYELHMQIARQTIIRYFIEALRADKLSSSGITNFLLQTWMGKETSRTINGEVVNFSYIQIVESGINSLFQELTRWKTDINYFPNFISATDSLVLKVEYFLREFCHFLQIPTFKPKPNDEAIVMERNIDDILSDQIIKEILTENDHFFIKFILTEKAGYNLRNKVAHGLMDNIEYVLDYPVLALIIILKLSNYQLK
jgi:hypothetical protein